MLIAGWANWYPQVGFRENEKAMLDSGAHRRKSAHRKEFVRYALVVTRWKIKREPHHGRVMKGAGKSN